MMFVGTTSPDSAGAGAPALASALGDKWRTLQAAGTLVAQLGGLDAAPDPAAEQLADRLGHATGWRTRLAATMLDDLTAVMEPGLGALVALQARGQDTTHAARALWHEYAAARAALLDLLQSA